MTALIGPSGCGKSTFIRILNRMHEVIPGAAIAGRVELDGVDIYGNTLSPTEVRTRIGMVFQKPNPFPAMTIGENVLAGLKLTRSRTSHQEDLVEECLRRAGLWDEVKSRLNEGGMSLSGGQQQRLCIARALAVRPQVLLMDEPCSALDPISTRVVEETVKELARRRHRRDRHAQHAASARAFPISARSSSSRSSASPAGSSSRARRASCSSHRRTAARSTTSRDGSAEHAVRFSLGRRLAVRRVGAFFATLAVVLGWRRRSPRRPRPRDRADQRRRLRFRRARDGSVARRHRERAVQPLGQLRVAGIVVRPAVVHRQQRRLRRLRHHVPARGVRSVCSSSAAAGGRRRTASCTCR